MTDDDVRKKRRRTNRLLNALSAYNNREDSDDDRDPESDNDLTRLSLAFRIPSPSPIPLDLYSQPQPQPQPQPLQVALLELDQVPSSLVPEPIPVPVPPVAPQVAVMADSPVEATGGRGRKRSATQNKTIVPPFPWATDQRATVHSYESLVSQRISIIVGTVQCKKCEKSFEIEYNLKEKFYEIWNYIEENKASMRHRAPPVWMNPVLPRCKMCNQENSAKPVFPPDKDGINWLFLLLGQMIGCCTLDQLKYFCEHTKHHRTGAKDRIVYYTYLGLCKQLDPSGPFDP